MKHDLVIQADDLRKNLARLVDGLTSLPQSTVVKQLGEFAKTALGKSKALALALDNERRTAQALTNDLVTRADRLTKNLVGLGQRVTNLADAAEVLDPVVSAAAGEPWDLFKSVVEQTNALAEALFDELYTLAINLRGDRRPQRRHDDGWLAEDYQRLADHLAELERRPVIGAELRRLRRLGEIPWDW
jgi:hypothetical protein